MDQNPTQKIASTATKRKEKPMHPKQKKDLTTEEKLEESIAQKKWFVDRMVEIEDDDYDLNDDDERVSQKIKLRDDCLYKAIELENQEREHVDFEDSETKNQLLTDELSVVAKPIYIYTMDLEPLNAMLTNFINHPDYYSDEYHLPTQDDIREMLRKIREAGNCPLYDVFVPKEGTDEFGEYITKILGQLKHRIGVQRHQNFMEYFEEGVSYRETQLRMQREGEEREEMDDEPMDTQEQKKPGTSSEKTVSETLMEMKEAGQIQKEEEPADFVNIDDDEEVVEIIEINSQTEAASNTPVPVSEEDSGSNSLPISHDDTTTTPAPISEEGIKENTPANKATSKAANEPEIIQIDDSDDDEDVSSEYHNSNSEDSDVFLEKSVIRCRKTLIRH